jgi:hypothetical protein
MLFVQVLKRVGNSSELHEDTDDGEETELRLKMWLKPQGEIEEQIDGNTLAVWHKPNVSILLFLLNWNVSVPIHSSIPFRCYVLYIMYMSMYLQKLINTTRTIYRMQGALMNYLLQKFIQGLIILEGPTV